MNTAHKVFQELKNTFLRRAFYRYDFEDCTNRLSLALRYPFAGRKRDWVTQYERDITQTLEVPFAVSFGAGRMAFYALLELLNIGPGDEVIIPAFTCVVVPNAIIYRGAKPVYVDINKNNYNIDVKKIEGKITQKTRCILAQHTFGRPCDIEAIISIAKKSGIKVIEDCAHSFGIKFKGRYLGKFADYAFVSTDHSKIFSTGLGGFVFCSNRKDFDRLKSIQVKAFSLRPLEKAQLYLQYILLAVLNHPRIYWFGRIIVATLNKLKLLFSYRDELRTCKPERYPVQLTSFQAYLGCYELRYLNQNIAHRRAITKSYNNLFQIENGVPMDGACLRYSLLVKSIKKWEQTIGKYFSIGRWMSSIAQGRTTNLQEIAYTPGSCQNAEYVAKHIINFPTHCRINNNALKKLDRLIQKNHLRDTVI